MQTLAFLAFLSMLYPSTIISPAVKFLINGIPVEAKNNYFSQSALSQLKRYMECYDSKFGIAAAPNLKVKLPEEIFFLRVTFSHETRRYTVDNKEEAIAWLRGLNK